MASLWKVSFARSSFMRNKLLVSVALLAAATTVGSCEKAPDREPAAGQSGSATSSRTSEDQQHQPGEKAQAPGDIQQSKESRAEQQPKVGEGSTEVPQQRDSSSEANSGQPGVGASGPGQSEPNQPQSKQAQVTEQNRAGQTQQPNSSAPAATLSPDQVRQAQMALQKKGFNPGEADGVLGPRTRKALIAFQQQQRLQANGQIDNQTLAALGMSEGAGSSTSGQNNAHPQ
jgi:hypothetical protein